MGGERVVLTNSRQGDAPSKASAEIIFHPSYFKTLTEGFDTATLPPRRASRIPVAMTNSYLSNDLHDPSVREKYLSKLDLHPLEIELLGSAPLRRLEEVWQMEARFTGCGRDFTHTRWRHSVEVRNEAYRFAESHGMTHQNSLEIRVAGLLHDIGHAPFAHGGEAILSLLSSEGINRGGSFDHDRVGHELVCGDELSSILRTHGLDPKRVAAILDHDRFDDREIVGLRRVVTEVADRLAYLRMEIDRSRFSREVKDLFEIAIQHCENNLVFTKGTLCTKDLRSIGAIVNFREMLFQEVSLHPATALVREILIAGVKRSIDVFRATNNRSTDIDPQLFSRMTDVEVLERLDSLTTSWLNRGVDNCFEVIGAWRLSDLAEKAHLPSFKWGLKNQVSQTAGIDPAHIFVTVTDPYDKTVHINHLKENGIDAGTVPIVRTIEANRRYLAVWIAAEAGVERWGRGEDVLADVMSKHTLPGAKNLDIRVRGPIDAILYEKEHKPLFPIFK